MKTFLGMIVVLLMMLAVTSNCQSTKTYQVQFTPNAVADSVKGWSIYLEIRSSNSGFITVDGMNYAVTLDPFYKTDILNTGQTGTVTWDITLPTTSNQWGVAGVIAYTADGLKSVVGASSSTKISKQPGKPLNVKFVPKP